ncbi:MAG: DUF507 family protein [Thermodesulfovibrionales bacterium]|jgi:hypothetical protein|nr:DUF507 family protein [Thermodesulfovibrionales bacterium]
MMLSEEKVSHLTHVLLKGLMDRDLIALNEEEGTVRREIKRIISNELKVGADIDEAVRKKLQSFSKKLVEGSPEWEILYKKFFREEEIKRGRASG